MKLAKFSIITTLFLIYFASAFFSPIVFARPLSGGGGGGCSIQPFSFDKGITPERFQRGENIASPVGRCDILQIVSNIIGLLYALIIPIAIIMVAIGGAILLVAGGNSANIKKGQAFIKSAIIGVAISLGAGVIIGAVIQGLGVTQGTTLMPWLF